MILVHWRLLNTTHRMPQGDWQRSAVKVIYRRWLVHVPLTTILLAIFYSVNCLDNCKIVTLSVVRERMLWLQVVAFELEF